MLYDFLSLGLEMVQSIHPTNCAMFRTKPAFDGDKVTSFQVPPF